MPKGQTPLLLRLEPVPEAIAQSRLYIREVLTSLGAASVVDAAELGVSELVTNACLHARTAITVTVFTRDSGQVRIEVGDDSPVQPKPRRSDPTRTTGRGLMLLSAYGDWGVTAPRDGGVGKIVWFEPASEAAIPRQPSRATHRSADTQIRR